MNLPTSETFRCPKGTKFHERLRLDHASIASVLQSTDSDLSTVSIRDWQRLGPYKDQPSRLRPLLVKFNCSRDVLSVFSAQSQLTSADGSSVYIKHVCISKVMSTQGYMVTPLRVDSANLPLLEMSLPLSLL